jgi:hypothetical protein
MAAHTAVAYAWLDPGFNSWELRWFRKWKNVYRPSGFLTNKTESNFKVSTKGLWRNGSASDSRSEGWAFESLWPHFLAHCGAAPGHCMSGSPLGLGQWLPPPWQAMWQKAPAITVAILAQGTSHGPMRARRPFCWQPAASAFAGGSRSAGAASATHSRTTQERPGPPTPHTKTETRTHTHTPLPTNCA